ncbi:hypothetical protein GCM10010176_076980 [Nonomuraea spiralis]|nr:hypothetical protein GCM10010176_076980 [Nonomuraea spiralis]
MIRGVRPGFPRGMATTGLLPNVPVTTGWEPSSATPHEVASMSTAGQSRRTISPKMPDPKGLLAAIAKRKAAGLAISRQRDAGDWTA